MLQNRMIEFMARDRNLGKERQRRFSHGTRVGAVALCGLVTLFGLTEAFGGPEALKARIESGIQDGCGSVDRAAFQVNKNLLSMSPHMSRPAANLNGLERRKFVANQANRYGLTLGHVTEYEEEVRNASSVKAVTKILNNFGSQYNFNFGLQTTSTTNVEDNRITPVNVANINSEQYKASALSFINSYASMPLEVSRATGSYNVRLVESVENTEHAAGIQGFVSGLRKTEYLPIRTFLGKDWHVHMHEVGHIFDHRSCGLISAENDSEFRSFGPIAFDLGDDEEKAQVLSGVFESSTMWPESMIQPADVDRYALLLTRLGKQAASTAITPYYLSIAPTVAPVA